MKKVKSLFYFIGSNSESYQVSSNRERYESMSGSVDSVDSNQSLDLMELLKHLPPPKIRGYVYKDCIEAIKTDNVEKFAKSWKLLGELSDHWRKINCEERKVEFVPKEFQPSFVFHKSLKSDLYPIHEIVRNTASGILKYVIDNMKDWSEINFTLSAELETYTYLHLWVFTMFYDEQIEEVKTTEGDAITMGIIKAYECFELLVNTPQIFEQININGKDRLGATALHYLATVDSSSTVEMLQFLVSKGADLEIKDREKNNVIHYAIRHKNVSDHFKSKQVFYC